MRTLLSLAFASAAIGQTGSDQPAFTDHLIEFESEDEHTLVAKLSVPTGAEDRVPVVMYLHGSGPRTYDNPIPYRDGTELRRGEYLEFFARELTRLGIAFFRTNKRGCTPTDESPWMQVERAEFSTATPSVLLGDYESAIEVLRKRPEIDPDRIVLVGASEGTWLAPRLAKSRPDGVVGVAMLGYAADNMKDTVVWQNTVGPFRNIQHLMPPARDGELTRDEYDELVEAQPGFGRVLPFEPLDLDENGKLTASDLSRANAPALEAMLKAIEDGDDDFIWPRLLNLTSAYLLEWWEAEPTSARLLELDVPLAIFHGELDGSCRVEGVRETQAVLEAAGRDNLTVKIYPLTDHSLNWTWESTRERGPQPFRDAFAWISARLRE